MSRSEWLDRISTLSVDERYELIDVIYESLGSLEVASDELPESRREELERRLADHEANPADVIPWEVLEAEALARA